MKYSKINIYNRIHFEEVNGMFWFVVIVVIVLMMGALTIGETETQEQKNAQQKDEAEYIENNKIVVTAKYEYANEYYVNNISWLKGIYFQFIVDNQNKKIHILGKNEERVQIPFSKIIGCEIFSDNKAIGGIKRAIVGGILAGDTGALIGAMTAQPHIISYKIVIYCSDIERPAAEILLINEKTSTKSKNYTSAIEFSQKVIASINAIIHTTY